MTACLLAAAMAGGALASAIKIWALLKVGLQLQGDARRRAPRFWLATGMNMIVLVVCAPVTVIVMRLAFRSFGWF